MKFDFRRTGALSWHDVDANRLGLEDNRPAERLQAQSRQTHFSLFNLGDFVDVLQADRSDRLFSGVARTLPLAFVPRGHLGGVEEEPRRVRRPNFEME